MNKPVPFLRKTSKITLWTIGWWIPYIKKITDEIRSDAIPDQTKSDCMEIFWTKGIMLLFRYGCISVWDLAKGLRRVTDERVLAIVFYLHDSFLLLALVEVDLEKVKSKGERPFLGNMLHIIGSRLRKKVILRASPLFVGPAGIG